MDWNGWGKLLQDFTKRIALNCVMNWMKPDRCLSNCVTSLPADPTSVNVLIKGDARPCKALPGHKTYIVNPRIIPGIYVVYIYIYCLQSPWISHNFTLQKLCRCITLSLQNASCSSFKPVRYPAIQIFQWGAWLTHETNYSCIGAPRIPSACTGLRDSGTEGKSLCLGSTILDLPAMWQNMWDSHWEMPVQTMESHENVEPIRCITSRITSIIKQIIIKFVCSCNISNFDQFRSIQINSAPHLLLQRASRVDGQLHGALVVSLLHVRRLSWRRTRMHSSSAVHRFPPSDVVLGWRCWHSSPTRSKRPSPRTGCCGAYCKGPVEL